MKLCRFASLFFDGTVITGKFCVGVPLNNQSIYLSKVQGRVRSEHCNKCAVFSVASPHTHVVSHSFPWWLHASENPSSILCVVSGHLCAFLSIKTYFQALFILLCQIKHYHTIPYHTIIVFPFLPLFFTANVSSS